MSAADQRDGLEWRAGWVVSGVTGRGLSVDRVVTGIGSGLNGHRRRLTGIVSDPAVSVLVVEHRDGLTRFGLAQLSASLSGCGWRVVVLEAAQTSDDLVGEVTGVRANPVLPPEVRTLTLLCVWLYGCWSASRGAAEAVATAGAKR